MAYQDTYTAYIFSQTIKLMNMQWKLRGYESYKAYVVQVHKSVKYMLGNVRFFHNCTKNEYSNKNRQLMLRHHEVPNTTVQHERILIGLAIVEIYWSGFSPHLFSS